MNAFYQTYLADRPEVAAQIQALDHESCEGKMSWDELIGRMVQLTGVERPEIEQFIDQNTPNRPLFDYIATELKPRYKIGLLSNAASDWLDELFTPDQRALFDDFVLSYQYKMRKPDVAFFELAAARLGVSPSECVLVDDVEAYCQGARRAGMSAIRYTSLDEVKSALGAL